MRNVLLIFIFLLLLTGCKKFTEDPQKKCFIPYVDFVAQHIDPSTLEVSFTPVSTYNGVISTYKWDFGDGTTYSGPTPPPHKYPPLPANGSAKYTVKYTVANECGEGFWTKEITIAGCLPDTRFSYKYVSDSSVQFTNQTQSSSAVNYLWNFGDGNSSTTNETSFIHVYKDDRPFVVSLKATNGCGENNFTDTISVCRKPSAAQTVTTTECGTVNIDASASKNGSRFQWNLGNGTVLPATPSTAPTLSYAYPVSGTYTIKLTVFNSSGCDSATVSNNVTVTASSLGTNSNWSYTSNDLDFSFTRSAIANATSYKWNFGDGSVSTQQNPTHSYGNPGDYTLTLGASNACGATYEFSVSIHVPYYRELDNTPGTGFKQVLAFSPSLIYFLGQNGKLYRTDTAGHWSAAISLPAGLRFGSDTRLFRDISNNLWIYGKGEVAMLNSNGTTWTSFFAETGFSDKTTISSMAIDQNNTLWTIGDGRLKKGNTSISSAVAFSSLAYAPGTGQIWLTSLNSNSLYSIAVAGNQITTVAAPAIVNGADDIRVAPNGELYFSTGTGIARASASGAVITVYASGNTGGMITSRPDAFDLDGQGNLWAVVSGQLYKVPIDNSSQTKKYSFNADLSNISWISVLALTGSDSDLLIAKTSGNVATKIR